MKTITCKLLSGTQENPVKVVVDADKTSATICWAYKDILEQNSCSSCEIIRNKCEVIKLIPLDCGNTNVLTGSIFWEGIEIFYEITQREVECPCNEEGETTYDLINSWVSPYDIDCKSEDRKTTLYYEFYVTTKACNKVISSEKKRKTIEIPTDCDCDSEGGVVGGLITTDEGFDILYSYNCIVHKEDPCDEDYEEVAVSSINYFNGDKPITNVLCSGGTIDYSITYQVITYDDKCEKKTNEYIYNGKWTIPSCQGGECCKTHNVTTAITYYKDYQVTLTMQMLRDVDGSCGNNHCEEKCVAETCYEVATTAKTLYYVDGEWVENGVLENYGGTVKIQFNYTAYTTTIDCVETTGEGVRTIDVIVPEIECDEESTSQETIEWTKRFKPFTLVCDGKNGEVEYKVLQKNKDCGGTECGCNELVIE